MPDVTPPDEPRVVATPLGWSLRYVSGRLSRSLAALVAANGVTLAEWTTLNVLHTRGPMSPGALAAEMEMTAGAVTRLVDRLVGKTLAVRVARRDDGRAQTLQLTKAGERLGQELALLTERNDEVFFGSLSERDQRALARIFMQLADGRRVAAGQKHREDEGLL